MEENLRFFFGEEIGGGQGDWEPLIKKARNEWKHKKNTESVGTPNKEKRWKNNENAGKPKNNLANNKENARKPGQTIKSF